MVTREYFDKNKYDMFPEIKDWTDPQNHLRFSNDVKHMTYKNWVFFHPSAYHLVTYSMIITTIILFGSVAIYTALRKLYIITAFSAFVAVYNVPKLYQRIKNHRYLKNMTFYDLWMREGL